MQKYLCEIQITVTEKNNAYDGHKVDPRNKIIGQTWHDLFVVLFRSHEFFFFFFFFAIISFYVTAHRYTHELKETFDLASVPRQRQFIGLL